MGRFRRKDKFKFNENDFKEELDEIKKSQLTATPQTSRNRTKCPKDHMLDDRNWSNIRNSYYCVCCIRNYSKEETIKD